MTTRLENLTGLAADSLRDAELAGAALVEQARRQWREHGPSAWVERDGRWVLVVMSAREFLAAYDAGRLEAAVRQWRRSTKRSSRA